MNTTAINDAYRDMVKRRSDKFTVGAKQLILEMERKLVAGELEDVHSKEELYENLYKTMKRKLLGQAYTTSKEKNLLLTLLDELKKVLNS